MGVSTFRRMMGRRRAKSDAVQVPPAPPIEEEINLHECAICGFKTKTALAMGAHMRRHKEG